MGQHKRKRKRPDTSLPPETVLWRAVVHQAMADAVNQTTSEFGDIEKRKAIDWLIGRSRDFEAVCDMADLGIDMVFRKVQADLKAKGIV